MLSIILPVYNEETNIGPVIKEVSSFLRKLGVSFEIIAVNDGSKNQTKKILDVCTGKHKNLTIITHSKNLGYGAALRSGFSKAKGELIFFTDSDRQFDIRDLAIFLKEIKNYDFIAGYRKNRQDSNYRVLFASIFRLIARFLFGVKIRDVDCAFKLFKREVLQSLPLSSSGALINLEIFTLAKKRGYNFLELPVRHFPRPSGRQTGANLRVILKAIYGLFPLWWRLQAETLSRKSKKKKFLK